MVWQEWSGLNRKWNDAWLSGLGQLSREACVTRAPAGLGLALSSNDIMTLQDLLNAENDYRKRPLIEVTGVWDMATCLTIAFYGQKLREGEDVDQFLYDYLLNWSSVIDTACQALAQQTAPAPAPAPPPKQPDTTPVTVTPAPAPAPTIEEARAPCKNGVCDCYVNEGDAGAHMENLQLQLNLALDQAGYLPIPMTGVYDAATCGAIYELGGAFRPEYPSICVNPEGEWIVPLECADMILPTKKDDAGKKSRAGMFAVGGLVVAAVAGGAYWMFKH